MKSWGNCRKSGTTGRNNSRMTFVQGHECQQRVGPELLISQSKEGNMNGNKIPDFTGEKQSDYSGETRLFLILRPETDFSCGSSDRAQIYPIKQGNKHQWLHWSFCDVLLCRPMAFYRSFFNEWMNGELQPWESCSVLSFIKLLPCAEYTMLVKFHGTFVTYTEHIHFVQPLCLPSLCAFSLEFFHCFSRYLHVVELPYWKLAHGTGILRSSWAVIPSRHFSNVRIRVAQDIGFILCNFVSGQPCLFIYFFLFFLLKNDLKCLMLSNSSISPWWQLESIFLLSYWLWCWFNQIIL